MEKKGPEKGDEQMKISRLIMMVVLLLVVPVIAFSSELGYMRISLIKGDVQVKTPESRSSALLRRVTEADQ